jgi:hypothetical protein
MRLYISGPIGGYADGNLPAFAAAATRLQQKGHEPVNPHDISGDHDGPCARGKASSMVDHEHRYGCYLIQDLAGLAQCDGLFALRGWQNSPGAKAEVAFAEALKLEILYEEEGD